MKEHAVGAVVKERLGFTRCKSLMGEQPVVSNPLYESRSLFWLIQLGRHHTEGREQAMLGWRSLPHAGAAKLFKGIGAEEAEDVGDANRLVLREQIHENSTRVGIAQKFLRRAEGRD